MNNNNHQSLNCGYAAEIVDFLYGEMSGDQKSAFHLHIEKCSSCAAEVADFSDIKFTIQDWKAAEFERLSTPEIRISYEKPAKKAIGPEKSFSWFGTVKGWINFSPVFSGAAAVLLCALLFGLGVFIFSGDDRDLIAGSNSDPKPSVNLPVQTESAVDPEKNSYAGKSDVPGSKNSASGDENLPQKQKSAEPVPVRASDRSRPKQRSQPVKALEKKSPVSRPVKNDQSIRAVTDKNKPRLNELPEEDEDNSLRLADLFAEIETRE